MGASWFGASWFGASWFGASWAGGGGGAGPPTFAQRMDRPLAELSHVQVPPDFSAKFRDRDWDPDFLSLEIIPQFLNVQIGGQSWEQRIALPAPTAITQAVLDDLAVLAVTERAEALSEIIQQHQNFQVYWLQLLGIDGASHPATFLLMKLAARVGELTMIVLKRRNKTRPRPSQVWPTLFPPVPVPGHAPYPAGHALIGMLTSLCLIDAVPKHEKILKELAARCGMNRVYAGLHYREDIFAGELAASQIHPFIKQCPLYQYALDAATEEWT